SSNPATIYAGLQGGGALKSNDGGATWTKMQGGLTGSSVFAMAIDPSNSATIYASTSDGLFKSTNGGESWNSNTPFSKRTITSIAFHPSSSTLVYASAFEDGLFASANGGDDWRRVNARSQWIKSVAISTDGNILYVGHAFGVEMSSDG